MPNSVHSSLRNSKLSFIILCLTESTEEMCFGYFRYEAQKITDLLDKVMDVRILLTAHKIRQNPNWMSSGELIWLSFDCLQVG
jgi:hypothetical protein